MAIITIHISFPEQIRPAIPLRQLRKSGVQEMGTTLSVRVSVYNDGSVTVFICREIFQEEIPFTIIEHFLEQSAIPEEAAHL